MNHLFIINEIKKSNNIYKLDYRKKEIKNILKDNHLSKDTLKDIIDEYKKDIITELPLITKDILLDNLISYLESLKLKELLKFKNDNHLPLLNNIKKCDLLTKLIDYSKLYYSINTNIDKLVKIQSKIRCFIIRNRYQYQGECILKRSLSVNEEDFYTCDNIKTIPMYYFFSYKDIDNFYYSYDIRSFQKLLDFNMSNPYNRCPISDTIKHQYYNRLKYLNRNNIKILEDNIETSMTKKQIFRDKVLTVFQKMNQLGHYTDINWFFNLSLQQLKKWYKEAEDIFNYRANLTIEQKRKIIPDNKAFFKPVINVFHNHDKHNVREIVLNEIDRFISLGDTKEDRYTGSLYVLTAFTIVSPEVAECIPWLVQI